ncbi:choice-of-anchor M domain-containing protein [Nocardioides daejeonensis]|uniref:choice-of-anchor M domain-containing protein n=1 Tax=Nocardioides daejeonensis TaxID=1046556 RepID=UPI0013A5A9CA|nr:choice-of-anchor M domain-containing protein [Nocardioides daejeonensis]
MTAVPAALAVGLSLTVAGVALSPAQAEPLRTFALDKGHLDLFEVSYDEDANGLRLSVKDDTYLHASGPVLRDPAQVSVVVDSSTAAVDVSQVPTALDFLKVDGDTVYQLPQTQNPSLPWPGWSTERLVQTLPGGTELPATGQPVQLEVEIDGPGNVFTWQTGSFGGVQNMYVDTVDPARDVIPIARDAHVHTNWAFTKPGDYLLTVTPSATTTGGSTLSGASASYHVHVGDRAPEQMLRIEGLAAHYHQGGTINLSLAAEPALTADDDVTWEWQWPGTDAWAPAPGSSGALHQVKAEQALDGVKVRATVTRAAGDPISSTPVTIDVDDHGAAARQRLSITGPATVEQGKTVTLARVLPDDAPTVLTQHRWESRADSTADWEVLAGDEGETLSFTATAASQGTQYRVSLLKPTGELAYGPSPVLTLGEQGPTPEPEPAPELGELADEYELTLLAPTNDGVSANALGINDEGDVVGITRPTSAAQPQRTVLWEAHGDHFHAHELANFEGSSFSRGFDLNDDLQIVGEAFSSGGTSVPIRWTGTGAPQSVGLNEAGTGVLNDISQDGVAVGTASGKAVRVSDDATTTLPAPGVEGATLNSYSATTIAEGEVIGGRASLKLAEASANTLHGVVWDAAGPRLLATPEGGSAPVVSGVRADGSAVGSLMLESSERAVLWNESGTPYLLELPGVADYSHASAKSVADGVVVGYTSKFAGNTSFGGAAVGWDAEGAVDLNSRVVDLPEGVALLAASDVNASGQIVGSASTADGPRGFVLTPVAEALHIDGLSGHYHSGGAITLTAHPGHDAGDYRWSMRRTDQADFHPITGVTGATLTLTAEQALDGARIKVERVVGGETVAASEPVTVEVDDHGAPPLQVVTVVGESKHRAGDEVRLAAEVNPASVLDTYQWFVKPAGEETATPIDGADSAAYVFRADAERDGAELSVAVVGEDGSIVYGPSAPHSLVVEAGDPTPKVASKVTVKAKKKVRAGKAVVVRIAVTARGVTPTGTVTVKLAGRSKRVSLNARGKAKVAIKVSRKTRAGTKKVKVTYRGDARVAAGTNKTARVKVTR